MFEKGDSSNSQKMNGCSFQQVLRFLFQHRKKVFFKSFILKPLKRTYVLLINVIRNFQNSPPFGRSACFYLTITGNDEQISNKFSEKSKTFPNNYSTVF